MARHSGTLKVDRPISPDEAMQILQPDARRGPADPPALPPAAETAPARPP